MLTIRKDMERGNSNIGWLNSNHTFSFSDYYDPEFMGFGVLRVINQDMVQPGFGFGKHAHKNMEIISYVVEGQLAHENSLGTGSIIKPGEIQRMSAGTGVEHSEFNHSKNELLHFLQIWIIPNEQQIKPSYEQKTIPQLKNKLIVIGSSIDSDSAVKIHQDVTLHVAYMSPQNSIQYQFKKGRKGWLQLIKGTLTLNNQVMAPGDGAAIENEVDNINIICTKEAEFLLFDLG